MITRSRLVFSVILALAVIFTFYQVPLASPQGITIMAAFVPGELPLDDPSAESWQQATAVSVPLNAQNVTRPMLLAPSIRSVTARALRNESQLALLVEWEDPTRDDSMVGAEAFRDAVAVQFPLVDEMPFFCMGQQGGGVNIWHWKADWQADLLLRQDMDTAHPDMFVDYYPFADDALYLPARYSGNLFASERLISPVESLVATGFGSLTPLPLAGQTVQGYGEWQNGKWRVVFSRELASMDQYTELSFTPGRVYPLAFAVWDGANHERGGEKSTSQWVSLQVERRPAVEAPPAEPILAAAPAAPATTYVPVDTEGLLVMGAGLLVVSLLCLSPMAAIMLLYRANRR
jgi:hypothetical protein